MPAEPRLIYFLVCDQARSEANSKQLYIGTYSRTLIAESFPVFLPSLVLVASIRPVKRSEKLRVQITIPGLEAVIEQTDVTIEAKNPMDSATYHYLLTPCVLPSTGSLEARFTFEDGSFEIGRLDLVDQPTYKMAKWD
jgi:hypothetical protein